MCICRACAVHDNINTYQCLILGLFTCTINSFGPVTMLFQSNRFRIISVVDLFNCNLTETQHVLADFHNGCGTSVHMYKYLYIRNLSRLSMQFDKENNPYSLLSPCTYKWIIYQTRLQWKLWMIYSQCIEWSWTLNWPLHWTQLKTKCIIYH